MFKQSLSWTTGRLGRCVLVVACACMLAACERAVGTRVMQEGDEPHYRRGVQMARSGQSQLALEAFLKVIDKRGGDAPESHFEVGRIYLEHIRDPIAAIYHFRKYLESRSNAPQAAQVRQLIDTAIKQFAATLAAKPLEQQMERLELLDMLEKLKAENAALRSEMTRIGAQVQVAGSGAAPRVPAATTADFGRSAFESDAVGEVTRVVPVPVEPPPTAAAAQRQVAPVTQSPAVSVAPPTRPAAGFQSYVVQPRDTLYAISVRFYGTGNRHHAILQANSDQLRSAGDLKPGMVLRIPPR